MLTAEGVVKLDVSVEPERAFSVLKIDSASGCKGCPQQTAKDCTGVSWQSLRFRFVAAAFFYLPS
jgi:hypothetical protein